MSDGRGWVRSVDEPHAEQLLLAGGVAADHPGDDAGNSHASAARLLSTYLSRPVWRP
jgi:hypothetical protein